MIINTDDLWHYINTEHGVFYDEEEGDSISLSHLEDRLHQCHDYEGEVEIND